VRVALVVDEVAEASQSRLGPELLESASGSGRVIADRARRSPADPRVLRRMLEHGVRVQVRAGRLHEHGSFDPDSLEQRGKIPGLEGSVDDRVLIGSSTVAPRARGSRSVMGVDKHRGEGFHVGDPGLP
jgi:hypothetical protein